MEGYTTAQWMFLASVGLVAFAVPLSIAWWLRQADARRRLIRSGLAPGRGGTDEVSARWVETMARAARPLARLSVPDQGLDQSELRRRFMQAGLRRPSAPILFFAIKTLLAFGLPLVLWMSRLMLGGTLPAEKFYVILGLVCGASFYAPNMVLNTLAARRSQEILDAFPDALDLLTICVEAGLSLEAALNRVASEMMLKSPTLAEELQMVSLEFRAGGGKEVALRNLALRTGLEDVDALVATLVQAEKFGTSMAESLRIHAETLRFKRQQRAEERAAKVAVKLIFPLVLCIFPAIMVVVGGPAMIRIVKTLPALMGG